jgi:hypothetical protein
VAEEPKSIRERVLDSTVVEACARAAHEANRAYCAAIEDGWQPAWESSPKWQQRSVRNGVYGVLVDGNGPRESHEAWLREKEATGWKYGEVKSEKEKTHPCFRPYDELPAAQRAKDGIFVTTVTAVAKAFGVEGATRG